MIKRLRDHTLPEGGLERIVKLVQYVFAQQYSTPFLDSPSYRTWEDIGQRAEKIRSRGRIARFVASKKDAKSLKDLVEDLNNSTWDEIMVTPIYNSSHSLRTDMFAAFGHTGNKITIVKRAPY